MPFNLTLRLSYLEKAFYLILTAHPLRLQTLGKSPRYFLPMLLTDWLKTDFSELPSSAQLTCQNSSQNSENISGLYNRVLIMTWMKTRQRDGELQQGPREETKNYHALSRSIKFQELPGSSPKRTLFSFLWSLHSTGMAGQLKSRANISFSLQGGWRVATSTTALSSCHSVLLCCFLQPALILKLPKGCLPHQHSKHYNPGLTTHYWIRNQGAHLWEDFLSLSVFLNCLQFFVYEWGPMGINTFVMH